MKFNHELINQQIGYFTRTNQLIDELFILIARKLTLQNNTHRDFPQSFMNLENSLRKFIITGRLRKWQRWWD